MPDTRNSKTLADFVAYCEKHPHERFWQALRNWCGYNFVFVTDSKMHSYENTFNWEGRRSPNEPD